jgi:hypothetical protein|tara:strand:- start:558 stop:1187 length:630 start_codon:yes stop_codon:yes gene_type:complete
MYGNQTFGMFFDANDTMPYGSKKPDFRIDLANAKLPKDVHRSKIEPPAKANTGRLKIIEQGQGRIKVDGLMGLPDLKPQLPEMPDLGEPIGEPTDDSGNSAQDPVIEEPVSEPIQTDNDSTANGEVEQTEPEAEPEPEAKTQISGGTVEFALPEWFKDSFTKGAKVVGVGILGYVAFVVADRLGVADKISDALKSNKKDEPQKSSVTSE